MSGTSSNRRSKGKDETDGNIISEILEKSLDVNKYATKKTIAQGLLDVALLTANASQLKYILQVGDKHEFYALMLTLISISIVLQLIVAIMFVIIGGLNINKSRDHRMAIILNDVVQACLCILLGSSLNLNKEDDHSSANKANNVILCVNILIMAVNILISSFEMKETDDGSTTIASTTTTTAATTTAAQALGKLFN